MEVKFKLNKEQAKKAMSIIKRLALESAVSDGEDVYFGNLLGYQSIFQGFNVNQFLDYDPETGCITYVGERHPLDNDGGLHTLYVIGTGCEPTKWSEVETSDWGFLKVVGNHQVIPVEESTSRGVSRSPSWGEGVRST